MADPRWKPVVIDEAELAQDAYVWLTQQMGAQMPYLLVHADDGVIWGKLGQDSKLILSSDVPFAAAPDYPAIAVTLRGRTIQQARVFGEAGELLIWRTDKGFTGRLIADGPTPPDDAYEETQLLWGVVKETRPDKDFTLLVEGQQGQCHAAPVALTYPQRAGLKVRHYVAYDGQDQAYVALSRLVDLKAA